MKKKLKGRISQGKPFSSSVSQRISYTTEGRHCLIREMYFCQVVSDK